MDTSTTRPRAAEPPLVALVDCVVCDGRGLMAARAAGDPNGPALITACPVCDGTGGFVEVIVTTSGVL